MAFGVSDVVACLVSVATGLLLASVQYMRSSYMIQIPNFIVSN